ncbi:MAG TPA: CBS domain-containing protein [Geobacterales bacterium]|nr:CBS domain-containing protein [Geobacterales bacterium]
MKQVSEIMTREVVTVKPSTNVRELARLFTTHRIGSIPVVDDAGTLLGIVTESDLVEQDQSLHIPTVVSLFDWVIYLESDRKFEEQLKKITAQSVADIYTRQVETVAPATPLTEVADLMAKKKVHALPVVEGGRLVGMVSRIDLIRTMVD